VKTNQRDINVVQRIPFKTFVDEYWFPEPGEHTALIGPTGYGKTTAGMKLLAQACHDHPETMGVALAMKPHKGPKSQGPKSTGDKTVATLTRALGGRVTRRWPPPSLWPWQRKPAFWTFWPTHSMDPKIDIDRHQEQFADCILDCYKRGDRWVFCDELYSLTAELKLGDEIVTGLSKGRSMHMGMIAATQRPAHVPLWFYSESRHFFLWPMTDGGAYDRLREIGNVDPHLIKAILGSLQGHDCLYLYAPKRQMAILTA
jgi:hypothetical protein